MKRYIVFLFLCGRHYGGWSDVLKECGTKRTLSFDIIEEAENFLQSLGLRASAITYQIVDVTTGEIAKATY